MDYKTFAHELIEKQCGTHSLGLVFNFLLEAGYSANDAETEFLKFISGQLPQSLLDTAPLWVVEDQKREAAVPITEAPSNSRELESGPRITGFPEWKRQDPFGRSA
jgi:hypothetical protein